MHDVASSSVYEFTILSFERQMNASSSLGYDNDDKESAKAQEDDDESLSRASCEVNERKEGT